MKVVIRMSDIAAAVPELIPAVRSIKDLPDSIKVEATLSIEGEVEKRLREKFPEYWKHLTTTEWRLFVALHEQRDCSRDSLRVLGWGEQTEFTNSATYKGSNVIDVHIKNLRRQFKHLGDKHHVDTRRGWGYMFREGAATEENKRIKRDFPATDHELQERRVKEINSDGTIKIDVRHKNRNHLNAVEFGYLKEMMMDEISKEDAARRLSIGMKELELAWRARNYESYVMHLPKKSSKRRITSPKNQI